MVRPSEMTDPKNLKLVQEKNVCQILIIISDVDFSKILFVNLKQ